MKEVEERNTHQIEETIEEKRWRGNKKDKTVQQMNMTERINEIPTESSSAGTGTTQTQTQTREEQKERKEKRRNENIEERL